MTHIDRSFVLSTVAVLAILLAFAVPADALAQTTIDPQRLARTMAKIDTSQITPFHGSIPASSYAPLTDLAPNRAGSSLTGETFSSVAVTAQGERAASANFDYEWRPNRAGVLLLQKLGSSRSIPIPGGTAALGVDAIQRLLLLGIDVQPKQERVHTLMRQLKELNRGLGEPETIAYKVIVMRELGGIPILGSRAVFTYSTDQSFRKLLLRWPAIAAQGNVLSSGLTPDQVAETVARDLIQAGVDDTDRISVRWVYEPLSSGPAEARLALRAEATLTTGESAPGVDVGDGTSGQPRVELVDPSRHAAAFCDVEMSQERYGSSEEKPGILQLRFANYTGAALAGRLRAEIRKPDGTSLTLYDQNVSMTHRYDRDEATTPQVSSAVSAVPRALGTYRVSCTLRNRITGFIQASDVQYFEVRGL